MARSRRPRFKQPKHYKLVSWRDIEGMCEHLADKMKQKKFQPDLIICLSRGGLVPARLMCDHLDVSGLYSLKVEHYMGTSLMDNKVRITHKLPINIDGKRVLVMDDIADSGETMYEVKKYLLKSFKPKELRTGTLQIVAWTRIKPDYYAAMNPSHNFTWFIYPWHVWEDTRFLMRKLTAKSPSKKWSVADMQAALRKNFDPKLRVQDRIVKKLMAQLNILA